MEYTPIFCTFDFFKAFVRNLMELKTNFSKIMVNKNNPGKITAL